MWFKKEFPPKGHFGVFNGQLHLISTHLVNDLQETRCILNVVWFHLFRFNHADEKKKKKKKLR